MKILFLTRLFYPHVGGIEKHIEEISKILIDQGHEVIVVTTKHKAGLAGKEEYKGIRIIRFIQPSIKFFGLIRTWIWMFKNLGLLRSSEIIHIHDVYNWYWPFRFLLPDKRTFLTIHGRWGAYPIPFKDSVQKKLGAKLAKGVIAIGEYITKNYRISADIVTYGATHVSGIEQKKNSRSIVYVGRMDKDIALSRAFDVFEKLDGYKINFCGDGELAKQAKKYGEVHGFVDPEPYYRRARYCFASGYLTILEALAHQCLTFTLYEHPLQEDYYKLTPFKDFIVTSDDPEQIYQKFISYSKNPEEAEKKIQQGYNWVKSQTWEKMVKNYTTLWGI